MDSKFKALCKRPLHETISAVCAAKDDAAKVKALRDASSAPLKAYLSFLFDGRHKFSALPTGPLPFGSSRTPAEHSSDDVRYEAMRHFYPDNAGEPEFVFYLTDAGRGNMPTSQVQVHFERLIRSVHPADVALLGYMKDKTPPEGLTYEIVAEAFPNLVAKWAPRTAPPAPGKVKKVVEGIIGKVAPSVPPPAKGKKGKK